MPSPLPSPLRSLIVTTFVTADGVMEAPGGGDHPEAGWTFKDIEFVPDAYEIKGREQEESSAILMGRQTYDEFAPIWHTMEDFASYNAGDKYVVSTTLEGETGLDGETVPWGGFPAVQVLRSLDDVRALKETSSSDGSNGPILVHGSARLAQSLAAAGLVDRYHLLVFPILLGSGKRLFGDGPAQKLSLVEAETFANGITKVVYDVVR